MSEELLMRIQDMAARIKELERENAKLQTLLKTSMEQHEIIGRLYQDCRNATLEEAATECQSRHANTSRKYTHADECAEAIRSMK